MQDGQKTVYPTHPAPARLDAPLRGRPSEREGLKVHTKLCLR